MVRVFYLEEFEEILTTLKNLSPNEVLVYQRFIPNIGMRLPVGLMDIKNRELFDELAKKLVSANKAIFVQKRISRIGTDSSLFEYRIMGISPCAVSFIENFSQTPVINTGTIIKAGISKCKSNTGQKEMAD